MNTNTFRTLEFDAVRSLVRGNAGSAYGRRILEALTPLEEPSRVREALARTTEACLLLRVVGRQPYGSLPDISESLSLVRIEGAHLEPAALLQVASFIQGATEIARCVAAAEGAPYWASLAAEVPDLTSLAGVVARAILPSGEVADDASPRLQEIRRLLIRLRAQLHGVMESFLRGREAERLLQDKLITTRNDRYVLLLKAEHRGQIPGIIHGASSSGASLFVEPLGAVELNNDIVSLQEDERREVLRILQHLTSLVAQHAFELEGALHVVGELDARQAMALLARDMDAVEPEIVEEAPALETQEGRTRRSALEPQAAGAAGLPTPSAVAEPVGSTSLRSGVTPDANAGGLRGARRRAPLLNLEDARHPLLMATLTERLGVPRRSPREPVPVSLRLEEGQTVLVISGPNTGGKTVALKSVGLLALMAQSGLHVPAGKGSRLPVFRRIYADIGDEQSIAENLSTFSAHLSHIVGMTADLALPALVLLDEVGGGTDPTEGGALGVAVVDHFRSRGALVVATTHHGLLKAYAQSTPGVACASFGYDRGTYEPTYRLVQGTPGRSLALEMAERLGLPAEVVRDARSRLDTREVQAEALLKRLEDEGSSLERERARLQESRLALEAREARLEERVGELEARKRREAEAFVKDLRLKGEALALEARNAIAKAVRNLELSRTASVAKAGAKARVAVLEEIREAQESLLSDPVLASFSSPPATAPDLAPGARVALRSLGITGDVLSVPSEPHEDVEVAVRGKRLRVPRSEISVLPSSGTAASARPTGIGVGLDEGRPSSRSSGRLEINLVGLTVDEAVPRVDKLLDEAFLREERCIRVIHGFGAGRLREAVADLLEGHPHVATFHLGAEGRGGVTVVELKE